MHKRNAPICLLVWSWLAWLLNACSDNDVVRSVALVDTPAADTAFIRYKNLPVEQGIIVTSLVVFPRDFTLTKPGASVQLGIQALLSDETSFTDATAVQWSSSDPSVFTVTSGGLVVAQGTGAATLTANLEGFEQQITVTVEDSGRTINGLVRYEDREYNSNGLVLFPALPYFKPVRYAVMDLLDAEGNVIVSTETNASGRFDFGYLLLADYQIRSLAMIDNAIASGFTVRSMKKEVYAVVTTGDSRQLSHDMQITASSQVGGAFNILDVMLTAADFAGQELNTRPANLTAFWDEGSNYGTYYCTDFDVSGCINGAGIYVYSQHRFSLGVSEADYDEYDDDVLMHEFGHFLLENYAKDDSPGGCHNLTDNNLDLRLAWSEGLGEFFPIIVKDWLRKTNPRLMSMSASEPVSLYIDTMRTSSDPSVAFISFDIANFTDPVDPATAEVYFYASSEIAIARVLWGISRQFGVGPLWEVVRNYFNQSEYPTSLPSFWDGFTASVVQGASDLLALQAIFNERHIYYQDDIFEEDSLQSPSRADLVAVTQPLHHLYRSGDALDTDYYLLDAVAGKRYTIQTDELLNGVDTIVRVMDEQGEPVMVNGEVLENDDAISGRYYRFDPACNGGANRIFVDKTSLASKLEFLPETPGSYYISVQHHDKFNKNDNFTGHYGSYKLIVHEE